MVGSRNNRAIRLFLGMAMVLPAVAQETDPGEAAVTQNIQPVEPVEAITNERIMGVIPNFATVSDPNRKVAPLTSGEKFHLFVKETADPFTLVSAAGGAGMSQASKGTPNYGDGVAAYAQRFGAAYMDMTTQNFFSDYFLASVLREDPRYYRLGPGHSIPRRVYYSLTRMLISKTDSGKTIFNFSGVGGMAMGIALSNAYYPGNSVSGSVTGSRFYSSMTSAALGNLLPEFWPDVKEKLDRWRKK